MHQSHEQAFLFVKGRNNQAGSRNPISEVYSLSTASCPTFYRPSRATAVPYKTLKYWDRTREGFRGYPKDCLCEAFNLLSPLRRSHWPFDGNVANLQVQIKLMWSSSWPLAAVVFANRVIITLFNLLTGAFLLIVWKLRLCQDTTRYQNYKSDKAILRATIRSEQTGTSKLFHYRLSADNT